MITGWGATEDLQYAEESQELDDELMVLARDNLLKQ
jgi:hypothetical protein